ncbi:MAG: thermonuclease family protein [Caldimicrobium sp.]
MLNRAYVRIFPVFFISIFLFLIFFSGCKGQYKREKPQERESIVCPQGMEPVKVLRVIDGDTVELEGSKRLRYAGINALELHTETGQPEPYAREAYLRNKELVEGKTLCFEKALRERDRYGRLLGDLYFPNGTSISEILVSEGLAMVCYYEGSGKFFDRLLPIQRKAIAERKNLFSYIENPQGKLNYIGNKKSRRFHHPQCKEARKIKSKVIFKDLEEALKEGYCPSRECSNLIFN